MELAGTAAGGTAETHVHGSGGGHAAALLPAAATTTAGLSICVHVYVSAYMFLSVCVCLHACVHVRICRGVSPLAFCVQTDEACAQIYVRWPKRTNDAI